MHVAQSGIFAPRDRLTLLSHPDAAEQSQFEHVFAVAHDHAHRPFAPGEEDRLVAESVLICDGHSRLLANP